MGIFRTSRCNHCSFVYTFKFEKAGLGLAKSDAVSSDLDLMIIAAEDLDVSTSKMTAKVSRSIESLDTVTIDISV